MSGLLRFKALSIKQPWANMIIAGEKTIETRVWATPYRGRLLLVSSKLPKIEPAGYAVGIADLVECRPMTRRDEVPARCELYPKAVAWVLQNVKAIEPIPVKGQLGIFDVELSEAQIVTRKAPTQPSLFD